MCRMEEWQKTLISTGIGFLAGMLSEPAKQWITTQRRKRQIRRTIYHEISQNLWYIEAAPSKQESRAQLPGAGAGQLCEVSSEAYDHYRTTSFEALLNLSEYQAFKELYSQMQGFADSKGGFAEKIQTAGLIAGT